MFKTLLILLGIFLQNGHQSKRSDNICSTEHIKRTFVKLGESGVLTAFNIPDHGGCTNDTDFREGCQIEIVTCPSCIISVNFKYMNLNCYCGTEFKLFAYNPCRCDYVLITEPPYNDVSGMTFCKMFPLKSLNESLTFRSKTRIVKISLFHCRPHIHAFTLEYKSEPNRQLFFGNVSRNSEPNASRYISTPFFPSVYPRDFISDYVLKCITEPENPVAYSGYALKFDCRVYLIFTDFQLASSSTVELFDGNRKIAAISGSAFRPPVVLSETNSLTLRFYASGKSDIGFKALYSFVSGENVEKRIKTVTDCGGFVENFGGTITMINMVQTENKLYDCIWLIKPLSNIFNIKNYLYLKIASFSNFVGEAELQVRQGITSESFILETIRHPASQNFVEHITPLKSGYYVRLRALFGPDSRFAISYASFSYNHCLIFSDFLCQNYRCISKKLNCDGFDHCGDGSDEPELCFQDWELGQTSIRRYIHPPNYYFPKMKRFSDAKTTSLVFLISLVALGLLILSVAVFTYRIGTNNRQERIFRNHLQQFHDLISLDGLSGEIYVEELVIDEPPCYEPPPNYEDVVKPSMGDT